MCNCTSNLKDMWDKLLTLVQYEGHHVLEHHMGFLMGPGASLDTKN